MKPNILFIVIDSLRADRIFGKQKTASSPFIDSLIKKGVYFSNGTERYFVDVHKLKDDVKDTTGAGDAFNGAFAYALSKNQNNKDAIEFANKVAGISTTRAGAANAMPKLKEVEDY